MPKMKSHRMAGLTCAMKNLIGINGDKSYIAHFRRGVKSEKSDEFEVFNLRVFLRERIWTGLRSKGSRPSRFLMSQGKRFVKRFVWKGKEFEEVYATNPPKRFREGGWRGNDTLWRCVADLNRLILYADKDGSMTNQSQRNVLNIVDAVIAGEGEGPLASTPKPTGIVFGGFNTVYVDYVAAKIMGFNVNKMPMIMRAFDEHSLPITDKSSTDVKMCSNVAPDEHTFSFIPTSGWKCLIEGEGEYGT
jgi:hypothetical protein